MQELEQLVPTAYAEVTEATSFHIVKFIGELKQVLLRDCSESQANWK